MAENSSPPPPPPPACSMCGTAERLTLYEWPARPGDTEHLCPVCVSEWCEHCGRYRAELVTTGSRNWRLCVRCKDSKPFARLRKWHWL